MTKNEQKYINSLKEENERIKNILICFMEALGKVRNVDDIDSVSLIPLMSELNKGIRAEIKAEAYKEFAERLKKALYSDSCRLVFDSDLDIFECAIDNFLKELVGEDNA